MQGRKDESIVQTSRSRSHGTTPWIPKRLVRERAPLGATGFVTHELTQCLPDAWVTNKPQAIHPNYRIMIDVSRFEVTVQRLAVLEADWVIL